MTPLKKWLRNLAEKALERYAEGEAPPERLAIHVLEFAQAHPTATRSQWTDFAATLARSSYQDGYLRGLEWAERDSAKAEVGDLPEMIADSIDPTWRDRSMAMVLEGGDELVPDRRLDVDQLGDAMKGVRPRRF